MKISLWLGAAITAATLSLNASAQAPAGTPPGSNGLCKDGTYSTAAKKSGACSGHKGVQTWYTDAATPSKTAAASTPAPAPAPPPASTPRPAPAAPPRVTPASTPTPAPQTAPTAGRRTPLSQMAPAPGGGPGTVWVNTASKVYHCAGTAYYGKTKAGKYVTEEAAKAEGDRADAGKPCTK